MSISRVKNFVYNMDYKWLTPQTYLVCIPLVSFVIQKIQMANILPLTTAGQNLAQIDIQNRKFVAICKAHLLGATVQVIILGNLIAAICAVSSPILVIMGSLLLISSVWELIDTYHKGLKTNVTYCKFDEKGSPKIQEAKLGNAISLMFL